MHRDVTEVKTRLESEDPFIMVASSPSKGHQFMQR